MSGEQFVLRWHYQEITILKNLSCYLDSEILCDCTLSVDSHNLKAHRLVLAMCSVYFFQLFQEMGDIQHPVIVLHNVGLEDIRAVLSFIYRGQCMVTKEQLPSLLSVAKLLKIQGLCDMKVPEKNVQNVNVIKEKSSEIDNEKNRENLNPYNSNDNNLHDVPKEKSHKSLDISPKITNYWENPPVFPEIGPKPDDNYNMIMPMKRPQKDSSETCKCFLCGKYLSNQYNLRVHMETHEEAYHACQSCPHVSRSRDALRKHVSYRHPEEYHTRKRKKFE